MKLYYWIRAKYRAWRYKRKYGINIEDALLEYGKHVLLTEDIVFIVLHDIECDCQQCLDKWESLKHYYDK